MRTITGARYPSTHVQKRFNPLPCSDDLFNETKYHWLSRLFSQPFFRSFFQLSMQRKIIMTIPVPVEKSGKFNICSFNDSTRSPEKNLCSSIIFQRKSHSPSRSWVKKEDILLGIFQLLLVVRSPSSFFRFSTLGRRSFVLLIVTINLISTTIQRAWCLAWSHDIQVWKMHAATKAHQSCNLTDATWYHFYSD